MTLASYYSFIFENEGWRLEKILYWNVLEFFLTLKRERISSKNQSLQNCFRERPTGWREIRTKASSSNKKNNKDSNLKPSGLTRTRTLILLDINGTCYQPRFSWKFFLFWYILWKNVFYGNTINVNSVTKHK